MKMTGAYAGGDWVGKFIEPKGRKPSGFGCLVADILGFVWRGIYHIDGGAVERARWEDENFITINIQTDMATWDFNKMTELVILAHDQCVRISIEPSGPRGLKIMFHRRAGRNGSMSSRHPTMDEAISALRSVAYREAAAGT